MSGIATAVIGGAVVGAGATILSGREQSSAAGRAADTQSQAALQAARIQSETYLEGLTKSIDAQMEMFNLSREDLAPWREAGVAALRKIMDRLWTRNYLTPPPFDPAKEPGYQFGYEELVEKPLMRRAASQGELFDPATHKALSRYAQDYSSTQYDNYLRRFYQKVQNQLAPYFKLAGLNYPAVEAGSQQATATGQNIGQNMLAAYGSSGSALGQGLYGAGQAQAYGQLGGANALTAMYGGLANIGTNLTDYLANYNRGGDTVDTTAYNNWLAEHNMAGR